MGEKIIWLMNLKMKKKSEMFFDENHEMNDKDKLLYKF